jgi:hypothetical protein
MHRVFLAERWHRFTDVIENTEFESSFDVRSIGIKLQIEGYPTGIVTFTIWVVPDIPAAVTHAECARFDEIAVAKSLGQGVPFDLDHVQLSRSLRHDS